MRWIGVRSYGIYLWHYPIIVLTTPANTTDSLGRGALQVAASIVVAALSWHFVEEPIRHGALERWWTTLRSARTQPAAAVTAGAAGAASATGAASAGTAAVTAGGAWGASATGAASAGKAAVTAAAWPAPPGRADPGHHARRDIPAHRVADHGYAAQWLSTQQLTLAPSGQGCAGAKGKSQAGAPPPRSSCRSVVHIHIEDFSVWVELNHRWASATGIHKPGLVT